MDIYRLHSFLGSNVCRIFVKKNKASSYAFRFIRNPKIDVIS